jgi:serine/threonine-protein kinase
VLRRLGSGGMSEVYLAYDEDLHRPIAIKVLPDDLAKNDTYVRRFQREAEMGQKIRHPNVVRCLELGQDAKTRSRFLVMEYVKGQSAQSRLERFGPLPVAEAVGVVLDIARGLEELHHCGYVHRDVKPGNILIAEDGRAKLADLGVAKLLTDQTELTSFDQGIGTPYYMPWEQSLHASLVDPRSDLFALGATFYHLVTGRVPFPGKDVTEVARLKEVGVFVPACEIDNKLPNSIDSLLTKLLARNPGDRFQTASQFVDALTAAGLTGETQAPAQMADTDLPPAATRPDLQGARKIKQRPGGLVWIYQYRHGSGWKRGRARTNDLIQWYAEGILPGEFYLARPGEKTCRHFQTFPEFAQLERRPAPTTPVVRRSKTRTFGLMVGVAVLLTAVTSTVLHLLLRG